MNVSDFAASIGFADILPDTDLATRPDWAALTDLERLNREIRNTVLPDGDDALRERVAPLLRMARMSTFAIAALINRTVASLPDGHAYVNVGVWHGFTLLAGMAGHPNRRCVGIDNFSQFGGPREAFLRRFEAARGPAHSFHDGDYRDYFNNVHRDPIGFYLYDGDHAHEHQLEGLRTAEPFFAPECYILVDDVNWAAPRRATFEFIAGSARTHEVVLDRRTAHNKHPTFWNGVTLLRSTA